VGGAQKGLGVLTHSDTGQEGERGGCTADLRFGGGDWSHERRVGLESGDSFTGNNTSRLFLGRGGSRHG